MKQKVIKIGSSVGITISRSNLDELGLKVGDLVETAISNGVLTVKPLIPQVKLAVDPKIIAWAEEFIEKNRELLLRLADKKPEEITSWLEKNSKQH